MASVMVGVNVYEPRFVPDDAMNVCAELDSVTPLAVMLVVGSAPVPAVTEPSTVDIWPTAMVRALFSTEPAALVRSVELIVAVHAAPVPRPSLTCHAVPGDALMLCAAPVTAVLLKLNGYVVIVSVPAVSVTLAVSAVAVPATRLDPTTPATTASTNGCTRTDASSVWSVGPLLG